MSAHASPPHIDSAAIEKLLVTLIGHMMTFPNGINEVKKAFHKAIGKKKGQLERTSQLDLAIAYLMHQGLDCVISDDADEDHRNADFGRRVKSLVGQSTR